jgi:hypothetical protein
MVYLDLLNISLEESFKDAEERFAASNPRSAQRFAQALEAMPGGNTRTVLHYTPFPLTITKGFGDGISMSMSMLICSVNTQRGFLATLIR